MSYGYSGNRGDDRYGDSSSYRSGGSSSYGGGGDRYGGGGDRYGGGGRGGDRYGGGGRGGPSASGAYGSGNSGIGGGLRDIQWDLSKLPVFEKNFYLEHPDVKKRSESESEQWRRTVQITIVGKGIPKPVYTFEEASMPEYILREVLKQGFKTRKFLLSIIYIEKIIIIISFAYSSSRVAYGITWKRYDWNF